MGAHPLQGSMPGGRILSTALVALAMLTVLAPPAWAHAAPNPLENAVHLLADEGEDSFYWYDGYDLYNLFVREAYWEPLDQEGLIFRFTLYGGFAPTDVASTLHIDIGFTTPSGEQVLRMSTTDDRNWTGDLVPLVANVTPDDLPFTGVTSKMQAFVPFEALDLAPGDSITDVWMASYADEDLVDLAPGGVFLPHSQGMVEVPMESSRVTDELPLVGPHGYMSVEHTITPGTLSIDVENILSTGQHVGVVPVETPGWNVSVVGGSAASVDGGEAATFTLNVSAAPAATAPLPVQVISDLGARDWIYVGVNGSELLTANSAEAVAVAPEAPATNESPGIGLVGLLVIGLVGLAARRPR